MSIALPEGIPTRRPLDEVANNPAQYGFGSVAGSQLAALSGANVGNPNLFVGGLPAAPQANPLPAANVAGFASLNRTARALNPQLPQVQSSLPTDAQYNAEQAQLAAQISQKYNDVLQQLGYSDPNTGNFVMGRIETEANRQRAEQERNRQLAIEGATQQRQLEGTLFSGRRGTEQARAEHPFVQAMADLDINTPQQLSDLYEQAGNIVGDYTLQNNLLLANLAQRRAAAAMTAPGPGGPPAPPGPPGPPDGGPPDGGGTTYDPYAASGTTPDEVRAAYERAGYTGSDLDYMQSQFEQQYQPDPYNPLIVYPGKM